MNTLIAHTEAARMLGLSLGEFAGVLASRRVSVFEGKGGRMMFDREEVRSLKRAGVVAPSGRLGVPRLFTRETNHVHK